MGGRMFLYDGNFLHSIITEKIGMRQLLIIY
jgi:hypothetical protein